MLLQFQKCNFNFISRSTKRRHFQCAINIHICIYKLHKQLHIHTHTHTHTYTHTRTRTRTHTHTITHIHTHTHTHTPMCATISTLVLNLGRDLNEKKKNRSFLVISYVSIVLKKYIVFGYFICHYCRKYGLCNLKFNEDLYEDV